MAEGIRNRHASDAYQRKHLVSKSVHGQHLRLSRIWALMVVFVAVAARAGEVRLDPASEASLHTVGVTVEGTPRFEPGKAGRGVLATEGVRLQLTLLDRFDPQQGTLSMWVCPRWPTGDTKRHTLFHTQLGPHQHVTLFTTTPEHILFVYKGNADSHRAVHMRIPEWKAGSWRHLHAAWTMTPDHGLFLYFQVEDMVGTAHNAVPLATAPKTAFLGSRGGREMADAVLDDIALSTTFHLPDLTPVPVEPIPMALDVTKTGEPMPRVWSFTTPWNSKVNRIPFDRSHPYYRRYHDAGFDMVRMVAFSEGWLWGTEVTRGADGKVNLDFSDFDAMVRMYREAGSEPYIRLAYHVPSILAPSNTGGHYYGRPTNLDEWREIMQRIVRHCVDERFGVRYYVTMLNEADIAIRKGDCTWEPILQLYEETTRMVREIDPQAKIGGPATCGPLPGVQEPGLREFLRFCRQRDLPPDFICFHQYKREQPRDYETAIERLKTIIAEEYPTLKPELFLDEWNLWARDERQNNEYAAAYLAAAVHYQIRAGLTRSSIVSFNSHLSAEEFGGKSWSCKGGFRQGTAPAAGARFYVNDVKIGDVTHPSLYTHSFSAVGGSRKPYVFGRYRVRIPAGATLRFATAIAIQHPDHDGCGMKVIVMAGGKEYELFGALVSQRKWQDHRVSLQPFANQEVDIEFRTDYGPQNSAADHAVWGAPALVAGTGDRVIYDFCERIADAVTGTDNRRLWYETQELPMIKGNVVTPVYFTWWLLNHCRGERLQVQLEGRDGIHASDTVGALACRDGDVVRILMWHFDANRAGLPEWLDVPDARASRTLALTIHGPKGKQNLRRYLIDHSHSNAYTQYVLRGEDSNKGEYNLESGTVDLVEEREIPADGTVRLSIPLRNLSVSLLELEPK